MKKVTHGGGWPAIRYTLQKAKEGGGLWKMWSALRSKNACKTCALGMGGQRGGMRNERGGFPEVCKKSLQAMASDMQPSIDDSFWQEHSIEQLRAFTPRELETSGRLVSPVLYEQGATHYRPIDWNEALKRTAAALAAAHADQTFWYFSGRSSNEAGFLLQLFARLYGTNNVNNCSYYCHQASGVGLTSSLGTGTATIVLDDVEKADLVFVIGGNPASNHPRMLTLLADVRRRGGEVIVINPVVETGLVEFRIPSSVRSMLLGDEIASLYVQPDVGGDLALLTGIAKQIDELGAVDESFLADHCTGADNWLASIRSTSWEEILGKSGVSRSDINRIAKRYARSKAAIFSWTMGITHHTHGVENVQAIANLALMRGMIGRPGAGLMPIRGHSNVQGIGSVGATPQLKGIVLDRLESELGVKLPKSAGLDTLGCIDAADAGKIRTGICLGGNLYGSNPDPHYAAQSLCKIDTLVYLNTTLNTGHALALGRETIILPVLARDEEPQATTQESLFSFVRLSEGGNRRHQGPRSEVDIIASLAGAVLNDSPLDWEAMQSTQSVREMIARVIPGYEAIAQIDQTKKEFHIGGRTFHKPLFPLADGRAILHCHTLPELRGGENEFRLITARSEGQFNTVVYDEYDLYRNQDRRDIVLIHPDDVAELGVEENERVTVRNETGSLEQILVRPYEFIKPGNVLMYFPEANVLVPRTVDPVSRTPAFKGAIVEIVTAGN